jgi:hypothetical protein
LCSNNASGARPTQKPDNQHDLYQSRAEQSHNDYCQKETRNDLEHLGSTHQKFVGHPADITGNGTDKASQSRCYQGADDTYDKRYLSAEYNAREDIAPQIICSHDVLRAWRRELVRPEREGVYVPKQPTQDRDRYDDQQSDQPKERRPAGTDRSCQSGSAESNKGV